MQIIRLCITAEIVTKVPHSGTYQQRTHIMHTTFARRILMSHFWICLIPTLPFLGYGIVMLVIAYRHKRNLRLCTETVNARILSLGKHKIRCGYRYTYQVRYSRQGEQFTPSFTTLEFLGEVGENTTLYIDPSDHGRYLLPDASAQITGKTISAIVFFALALLFIFVGIDVARS